MTCEEQEVVFFAGGAGNLFSRNLLVDAVDVLALGPQTLLFMCSKQLGEAQVYDSSVRSSIFAVLSSFKVIRPQGKGIVMGW